MSFVDKVHVDSKKAVEQMEMNSVTLEEQKLLSRYYMLQDKMFKGTTLNDNVKSLDSLIISIKEHRRIRAYSRIAIPQDLLNEETAILNAAENLKNNLEQEK